MQLDVSQRITTIDGKPYKNGPDADFTLKDLLVSLLLTMDEKGLQGSEKIERNKTAEKIYAAASAVDLSLSEVTKIRSLIDSKNSQPVRVVAEALRMFEDAAK